MTTKICRIGHRTPNKGVITIASIVEDSRLYYGVSYCSPKEKQYNKKLGNDLALNELNHKYRRGMFTFCDKGQKHSFIIKEILMDILDRQEYPRWSEDLMVEQLYYPTGLKRYPNDLTNFKWPKFKIIVDDEDTKEQLLLASNYIHNLREIDPDFVLVNQLAHIYERPEFFIEIDPSL